MPTEFLLQGVADELVLMIADGVNDRCTYEKMSVGVKKLTDNQLLRAVSGYAEQCRAFAYV